MKLNLNPERRILAQFAWFALVAFPLLAGLFTRGAARWYAVWDWQWSHPVVLALAALGALQLVLFVAGVPALSRALWVALTLIAFPIGFVVSMLLMALIYYLVVTPIGLVFRLIGRDVMGKRLDPKASSYWHDRGPPRPASSYFKLY